MTLAILRKPRFCILWLHQRERKDNSKWWIWYGTHEERNTNRQRAMCWFLRIKGQVGTVITDRHGFLGRFSSRSTPCNRTFQIRDIQVPQIRAIVYIANSLGYLLIYPPQIATVMKPISFCSMYSPVSHTKSLGESRGWNMVFQGNIWYRLKAFWKWMNFLMFGHTRSILLFLVSISIWFT